MSPALGQLDKRGQTSSRGVARCWSLFQGPDDLGPSCTQEIFHERWAAGGVLTPGVGVPRCGPTSGAAVQAEMKNAIPVFLASGPLTPLIWY